MLQHDATCCVFTAYHTSHAEKLYMLLYRLTFSLWLLYQYTTHHFVPDSIAKAFIRATLKYSNSKMLISTLPNGNITKCNTSNIAKWKQVVPLVLGVMFFWYRPMLYKSELYYSGEGKSFKFTCIAFNVQKSHNVATLTCNIQVYTFIRYSICSGYSIKVHFMCYYFTAIYFRSG